MSKASRMFRTRSNRGGNLAVRPTAQLDVPTFAEADLSSCLAAMYNSSTTAFLEEVYAGITPAAPSANEAVPPPPINARLRFARKSVAAPRESNLVLAILPQTKEDPPAPSRYFRGAAAVIAATFQDDATI